MVTRMAEHHHMEGANKEDYQEEEPVNTTVARRDEEGAVGPGEGGDHITDQNADTQSENHRMGDGSKVAPRCPGDQLTLQAPEVKELDEASKGGQPGIRADELQPLLQRQLV